MKPYSVAFKHKMVERLVGADAPSAKQLSREIGIPQVSLSRWVREARSSPRRGLRQAGRSNAYVVRRRRRSASWAKAPKLDRSNNSRRFSSARHVRLAEFEQWRFALEEGGRAVSADDQAHPRARARARAQGEGARRGGGAAHPQKKSGRTCTRRTRTKTRTTRARSDPRSSSPKPRRRGRGYASACRGRRTLGAHDRALARWPERDDASLWPAAPPTQRAHADRGGQVVAVHDELRATPALSPKQLVPRLADEGLYLASESTMYRLQRRHGLRDQKLDARRGATSRERARSIARPARTRSGAGTSPGCRRRCEVVTCYLYLVMDVWSRRIVGWTDRRTRVGGARRCAHRAQSCDEADVDPRGLVLHSDNGTPMRGSTMIATLQWLGIVPSFSRPHVSDDNPYSEALFRTLKYTPAYPRAALRQTSTSARAGSLASSPGTTASTVTARFAT